jgi:hypothetical protein
VGENVCQIPCDITHSSSFILENPTQYCKVTAQGFSHSNAVKTSHEGERRSYIQFFEVESVSCGKKRQIRIKQTTCGPCGFTPAQKASKSLTALSITYRMLNHGKLLWGTPYHSHRLTYYPLGIEGILWFVS